MHSPTVPLTASLGADPSSTSPDRAGFMWEGSPHSPAIFQQPWFPEQERWGISGHREWGMGQGPCMPPGRLKRPACGCQGSGNLSSVSMCPRLQVPRWEFTSAAYPQINVESALPSGPWLSQYLIQGPASIQGLCAESLSIENKPHLLRGQKALPTPGEIWACDQGTPALAKTHTLPGKADSEPTNSLGFQASNLRLQGGQVSTLPAPEGHSEPQKSSLLPLSSS